MHSAHTIMLASEKAHEILNEALAQIGEGSIREGYDYLGNSLGFYADIRLPLHPQEKHYTERVAVLECRVEITGGRKPKAKLTAHEVNLFTNITTGTPEADEIERMSRLFTETPDGRKRVIDFAKFTQKSGSMITGKKLIKAIIKERKV